jgi:hypothetical protein
MVIFHSYVSLPEGTCYSREISSWIHDSHSFFPAYIRDLTTASLILHCRQCPSSCRSLVKMGGTTWCSDKNWMLGSIWSIWGVPQMGDPQNGWSIYNGKAYYNGWVRGTPIDGTLHLWWLDHNGSISISEMLDWQVLKLYGSSCWTKSTPFECI